MRASAKATRLPACLKESAQFRPPLPTKSARREFFQNSLRSSAGKYHNPETSCAFLSAAAKRKAKSAILIARKNPDAPTTNSANAVSAPCFAPTPFFSAFRRPACSIRCSRYPAPTTNQATIAAAAARPATSCMQTIALRNMQVLMRASGTWEKAPLPIRPSRRMNPATQSATVLREPFLRANA